MFSTEKVLFTRLLRHTLRMGCDCLFLSSQVSQDSLNLFAPSVEFPNRDLIRFRKQRADFLKRFIARRKDADEKLRGIIGMGQEGI